MLYTVQALEILKGMSYNNIFDELITRYDLKADTYDTHPLMDLDFYQKWIKTFRENWGDRTVEGYWTFDLACLPELWYKVIDEAFEILNLNSPEFKILQVKLKYGGIRIYLEDISDDALYSVEELEKVLYESSLYY